MLAAKRADAGRRRSLQDGDSFAGSSLFTVDRSDVPEHSGHLHRVWALDFFVKHESLSHMVDGLFTAAQSV